MTSRQIECPHCGARIELAAPDVPMALQEDPDVIARLRAIDAERDRRAEWRDLYRARHAGGARGCGGGTDD